MRLLICTQAVDLDDPVLGFFHRWIEEFARHAECIHVLCLREGRHALPTNVIVHSLGKEQGRPMLGTLTYSARFLAFTWKFRKEYDAVFIHMNPEYLALGGLLWRVLGKKIGLWYVHKNISYPLRFAALFANHVFTVSEHTFPLRTVHALALGHGIDTCTFAASSPHPGGEFHTVTIGRIAENKNTRLIAEVMLEVATACPNVRCDIYGVAAPGAERRYESKLREWLKGHDAEASVRLCGPVTHARVPGILAQTDAFVSVSETGGVDKAVLEAMACSVPVVSASAAHAQLFAEVCPDLIADESVESLKKRLCELYRMSPEERHALGLRLREIVVKNHSLDRLIPAIMRAYTS